MAATKKRAISAVTNADWLEDIEDMVDSLQQRRDELHSQVYDADLEAEDLWSSSERCWRRLSVKIRKAESEENAPVNAPRRRNVDRLIQAIDQAYCELEELLE